MKKGALFLVSLFLSFSSFADDFEIVPDNLAASDKYVVLSAATIQIMNKQAGKVQTVSVPVNQTVKYDKLEILVKKCLTTNEFLPEDFFMFAEVKKNGQKIFSGWMTKSEPGQNPLQDADNDLWLVDCE